MKSIIFFIFLFAFCFELKAQTDEVYVVVHVSGKITSQKTGKDLKAGDRVASAEQLKFSETTNKAVVISTKKGRFLLSPKELKKENELTAFVYNTIIPLKTNTKLATRGNSDGTVSDVKNYFGTETFAIIGEQFSFKLSDAVLKDPSRKLVCRYETPHSDKAVNKIISKDNRVFFNKNELFNVKGKHIDPATVPYVELYIFDTKNQQSEKLLSFQPVFIDEKTLKNELMEFKKVMSVERVNNEQLNEAMLTLVRDIYGNTDEMALGDWIRKNVLSNKNP